MENKLNKEAILKKFETEVVRLEESVKSTDRSIAEYCEKLGLDPQMTIEELDEKIKEVEAQNASAEAELASLLEDYEKLV